MRRRGRGLRRRQGRRRARDLRDRVGREGALTPGFVCLIEIDLHFPEGGSLKGKRKELVSLKEHLRRRFGASVAETEHHDLWQRARLTAAIVARDVGDLDTAAVALERHVVARIGDGASCHRVIRSSDEVMG